MLFKYGNFFVIPIQRRNGIIQFENNIFVYLVLF